MKTWQQSVDEHTAGLTGEQLANPRIRNLVRMAADLELAEQAGSVDAAEDILARYDRAVAKLGYNPLA